MSYYKPGDLIIRSSAQAVEGRDTHKKGNIAIFLGGIKVVRLWRIQHNSYKYNGIEGDCLVFVRNQVVVWHEDYFKKLTRRK